VIGVDTGGGMADVAHAREWDELRNIDYFLEHLARAVERGEVHRASYDLLTPRYLERRAELASIIQAGVARAPGVPADSATPATRPPSESPNALPVPSSVPPTPMPAPELSAPTQSQTVPTYVRVAREPKPVPWTTILTITGAFLVIVAAAIFAVATWDLFGVEFKLVFLGTLTAGFYGAGYLVRKRLHLDAGGVALMAVGSAMLLFDGWIAIDGYGLEGPWPWVFWLGVCSIVYWYSETAIGGSFFGVIGATAQVAWVWLLGEGLAWPLPQRAAGIAVVAVLWALAARRAADRPPFMTLAAVLRWAAPVTIAGCAFAMLQNLAIGPATWTFVFSALVVALAATSVFDLSGLPRGVAAIAWAPLFAGLASLITSTGSAWGHVALLAAMVVGLLLYELVRGGSGHGVLSVASELLAAVVLADVLAWEPDATLILVAVVATSWLFASRLLDQLPPHERLSRGAPAMRVVTEAGGWVVLGASTLLMPAVSGAVPLAGFIVTGKDTLLAAIILCLWGLAVVIRPRPVVGYAILMMSLYTTAAAAAWLRPALQSALYALALVGVLAVWFVARRAAQRIWLMPTEVTLVAVRLLSVAVLVFGLLAQAYFFEVIAWQSGVLILAVALLWLVDALRAEESQFGLALSSALLVLAAVVLVDWAIPGPDSVSWAGPVTALACVAAAIPLRGRDAWAHYWCWGAGVAALVSTAVASGPSSGTLALALALTAAVWLASAIIGKLAPLGLLAGALGYFALFAWADYLDLTSWGTVAIVAVPSFILLAALFVPQGMLQRMWADVSASSGFLGLVLLCILAAAGASNDPLAAQWGWDGAGAHEFAAAIALLGVYVIVAGIGRSISLAPYVGVGLILLAYVVELDTRNVGTVEWVTTPLALYIIWAGSRMRRGAAGRGSPVPDVLAAIVGLGVPALLAASPLYQNEPWLHLVWAVGLSLVAILAGVVLKVRGYFFGGIAALVFTAIVRSWFFLVAFWWLVLGIIGVTMLVIALTWERQQLLVASAQRKVHQAMADWR